MKCSKCLRILGMMHLKNTTYTASKSKKKSLRVYIFCKERNHETWLYIIPYRLWSQNGAKVSQKPSKMANQ